MGSVGFNLIQWLLHYFNSIILRSLKASYPALVTVSLAAGLGQWRSSDAGQGPIRGQHSQPRSQSELELFLSGGRRLGDIWARTELVQWSGERFVRDYRGCNSCWNWMTDRRHWLGLRGERPDQRLIFQISNKILFKLERYKKNKKQFSCLFFTFVKDNLKFQSRLSINDLFSI